MAKVLEMKQIIQEGGYDAAFKKLYGGSTAVLTAQRERYCELLDHFAETFGNDREISLYSAPGRTEIGGNHTDHNNGVVMAAAVNLDIITAVSKNEENIIRVKSMGYSKMDVIDLSVLTPVEEEREHSAAIIRGMAAGIAKMGGKIGGFDAYTMSSVLRGSGLSSSAAFEVCMGAILRGEYNDNDMEFLNQVEIAKLGQYAENVFFGKPCGLMDQTACAVGGAISIDFADPKNPIVEQAAFDLERHGFALCISDTKGSHADLTDDYAAIRREMESVAECFGKKVLREVPEEEMIAAIPAIRGKVGDRAVVRAIHFYNECHRALALRDAIAKDEFDSFLKMVVNGGHSSFEYNQNAYSTHNVREQGISVALAISQRVLEGKGAWRLQGGGFAGTIQAFVPAELVDTYRKAIDGIFGEGSCYVLSIRNYGAVPVTSDM